MLRPEARWPARLALRASGGTRVHAEHEGPLRLLKTLYPEGPGIAHAVIVHPPGGLVGGDRLDVAIDVEEGAHLLATTPAATRFYRSNGPEATQAVHARVAGRLEWLPQETLAYRGCGARNRLRVELQGQLIACELLALGLPEAGEPFDRGELLQELRIDGLWLDRGWLRAQDRALMQGRCGLAGQRVLGTLLMAQARPFEAPDDLLAAAREAIEASGVNAAATLLHGRLLLMRLLAQDLEAPTRLMRAVRAIWREAAWGLGAHEPRIWRT